MENKARGMTLIVKTVTRLSVGLIMVYGIFTVLKAHASPGGGFAGGVILALAFINMVLAFGKGEFSEKVDEAKGLLLSASGALVFLILSFLLFLARKRGIYCVLRLCCRGHGLRGLVPDIPGFDHLDKQAGEKMSLYFLCFILFSVGLYCVLRKRNIIKIIIGIAIIEYAVNMFLILIGYRMNGRAPIFEKDQLVINMVDPLVQAMVLTTIVIGLALVFILVALAIRIYEKYGTFDITKIRRLNG